MTALSQRAQSLGTENAFVVLAEVNKLIREGRNIISFCIGQPDFATPQHIQDAGMLPSPKASTATPHRPASPSYAKPPQTIFRARVAFKWMPTM